MYYIAKCEIDGLWFGLWHLTPLSTIFEIDMCSVFKDIVFACCFFLGGEGVKFYPSLYAET